jgi:hypothetical protein
VRRARLRLHRKIVARVALRLFGSRAAISVGGHRYRRGMAEPAAPTPAPSAPPADPTAIRACLHPDTAAVFDAEWELVLEEAKHSKDLTEVHELLHKWRFFALEELKQPGWYGALMSKAERILRTGINPGAVSWEDLQELLARRRGE